MHGKPIWQRNYFEHIIRNDREMERIRHYIETNPSAWMEDDENPLKHLSGRPDGHGHALEETKRNK